MEISEQLGKHNELMEKAMEKQQRMETKINRIEQRLMEKEILNYKVIQEKLEKRKEREAESEKKRQAEHERKKLLEEEKSSK